MGWRASGVWDSLDPSLQSMPMPWPHSCACAVLCVSLGTRLRMFVPGECCPTSAWPLLQPSLLFLMSVPTTVCYYQRSLAGSTAIQLSLFETYTLAPYLLGFSSCTKQQECPTFFVSGDQRVVTPDRVQGICSCLPGVFFTLKPEIC